LVEVCNFAAGLRPTEQNSGIECNAGTALSTALYQFDFLLPHKRIAPNSEVIFQTATLANNWINHYDP